MDTAKEYIDLYNKNKSLLKENSTSLLNKERDYAFNKFSELGFPYGKLEYYKDCDFRENLNSDYGVQLVKESVNGKLKSLFSCDIEDQLSKSVYVINDEIIDKGQTKTYDNGVVCGSLRELSRINSELLEPYYNKLAKKSDDGMVHFNTSFLKDGVVFYVPSGVSFEKPFQIIQMLNGPEDMLINRRILVVLEKGAHADLLICDHALSQKNFFVNQDVEVFVGEGASLQLYELEMNHINTTKQSNMFVKLEANSNCVLNNVTIANGSTRNNLQVDIDGQGANADLSGLVLENKDQFVDNHIRVNHNVPNCCSNQLYKYVVDGSAKGVFNGRILVDMDSQKTVALQSNKNMVVSNKAKMISKPQLEIYADDVKCNHGSATGKIDENALFYIRQRGISEKEARLLLQYAFSADVLEKIKLLTVKERMQNLVEKRFRGEDTLCLNCRKNIVF